MKKKILFITGTRADFGKLKSLILQVQSSIRFEHAVFATGMHLLAQYGMTVTEIMRSKITNIHSFRNQRSSERLSMDRVLANTIAGLSTYVATSKPDLIVVHGDRVEALAGAVVGSLNNILVAHIEGGELSGTVDELIRHSISKLAHLHFVANQEARQRLIQMGELPNSIFVIGSPEIDIMLSNRLPKLKQVTSHYQISFANYLIFAFHPVTTELDRLQVKVNEVLSAVLKSQHNFVVIYPNNDPGSELIMAELLKLKKNTRFRLLPSMRFEYFLTLLRNAKAIVGNSSAGVREAPVYGVPTINIGSRQKNRFHHSSILDVDEDQTKILAALTSIPSHHHASLHFGSGNSSRKFLKIITGPKVWLTPKQKQFRDVKL